MLASRDLVAALGTGVALFADAGLRLLATFLFLTKFKYKMPFKIIAKTFGKIERMAYSVTSGVLIRGFSYLAAVAGRFAALGWVRKVEPAPGDFLT